jgi:hypothetical protein
MDNDGCAHMAEDRGLDKESAGATEEIDSCLNLASGEAWSRALSIPRARCCCATLLGAPRGGSAAGGSRRLLDTARCGVWRWALRAGWRCQPRRVAGQLRSAGDGLGYGRSACYKGGSAPGWGAKAQPAHSPPQPPSLKCSSAAVHAPGAGALARCHPMLHVGKGSTPITCPCSRASACTLITNRRAGPLHTSTRRTNSEV